MVPDQHQLNPRTQTGSSASSYMLNNNISSNNNDSSNDEVSQYFPTPSPRKPYTPTPYQNLAENGIAQQRPQQRLETVTPNRLGEHHYNHDSGEFKRSASARLHRNKRNNPDAFNQTGEGMDDTRKKEQVLYKVARSSSEDL